MSILMINLESAHERLAFQRLQFSELGIGFERIAALSGHEIDSAYYNRMKATGARIMERNEVACLLSHAKCWQIAVDRNKPVLIIEDDVVVDPLLGTIVDSLFDICASQDALLQLESNDRPKLLGQQLPHKPGHGFKLFDLIKSGRGAAGYMLTPRIAKVLLDNLTKRLFLTDTYLFMFNNFRPMQLAPPMFVQLDRFSDQQDSARSAQRSTIRNEELSKPSSLRSLITNPATRIQRLRTNIRTCHRWLRSLRYARRRYVKPRQEMLQALADTSHKLNLSQNR